jgi:ribosome-associated translation inhibitor RaiA
MKTDVQSRGFSLTPALRDAVEHQASAFASRFAVRPRSLQVRLFDVNGATRGGPDKGCLASARLGNGRTVVVASDVDSDLYRAIASAFAKLVRGTRAVIGKRRAARRPPHGIRVGADFVVAS